jgi:hypothetical protein
MVYVRGAGGPVHRGRRRRKQAGRRARRGRRRGSPRTPRPGRPPGIRAAGTPPGRCWTPGPCSSPSDLSLLLSLSPPPPPPEFGPMQQPRSERGGGGVLFRFVLFCFVFGFLWSLSCRVRACYKLVGNSKFLECGARHTAE